MFACIFCAYLYPVRLPALVTRGMSRRDTVYRQLTTQCTKELPSIRKLNKWLTKRTSIYNEGGMVHGGNARFATNLTMANLKIFFFLLGDSLPSNDVFPIIAPPGISVGELKDEVYKKKQNGLKGIDASALRL
jgi:hypothetical protein